MRSGDAGNDKSITHFRDSILTVRSAGRSIGCSLHLVTTDDKHGSNLRYEANPTVWASLGATTCEVVVLIRAAPSPSNARG